MIQQRMLIIVSCHGISGAEYLIGDFLESQRSKEIWLIIPEDDLVITYFSKFVRNDKLIINKHLRFKRTKYSRGFNKIISAIDKLRSFWLVRRMIKNVVLAKNIDVLVGHNTMDLPYIPQIRKKKILFVNDDLRETLVHRWYMKIFSNNITAFIAGSEGVKKQMILAGVPGKLISIVYNGIIPKVENPKNISTDKITLGWIGSFDERKNPLEFVKILENISNIKINALMIFRKVNEEFNAKVLFAINKVTQRIPVSLHENVHRDSLEDLYNKIDILFCTSIFESLPTVLLEAFACGIPVIARNIDGVNEIIVSGKNGYLYNNLKEVNNYCEKITSDYFNFSLGALCTLKDKFSPEKKCVLLEKILWSKAPN